MANRKVSMDGLADAIAQELAAYNQEVTDGMKDAVKEAAKECKEQIKQNSPVLTGGYRTGWADKVLYDGREDIRITVYNRTDYQLAHLLEHGHAKVNGGRVAGKAHIGPAAQDAEDKLLREIQVVVRG